GGDQTLFFHSARSGCGVETARSRAGRADRRGGDRHDAHPPCRYMGNTGGRGRDRGLFCEEITVMEGRRLRLWEEPIFVVVAGTWRLQSKAGNAFLLHHESAL